jgi:multiple sugar transport system substrate-binding protein
MRAQGWRRFLLTVGVALLAAGWILPASGAEPVSITFWHGMSGVLLPPIDALTADFNKLNPGIVVNPQYQGSYATTGSPYRQKLIAAAAAGNPPTLAQVYPNYTDQLSRANALVPMEKFIKGGTDGLSEAELNDIVPALRQANTFNGVMWTMPFNKSLHLLFFNADLLKERHLNVPQTWDDLRAAAKALTQEDGGRVTRYGFVVRPTPDYFFVMLLTNGGEFLRTDKEVAFNSPAGVQALQFLVDLVNKDKVAYLLPGFPDADLGAGRVAMYFATNPGLAFAKEAVAGKFAIGLAPLPSRKTRATLLAGTDLAIFAKATPEQQAAAWKYVKFLTSPVGTARWSVQTFYMPVRRSAIDSTLMQVALRQEPALRAGIDSVLLAKTEPTMAEWQEIRDIVEDAVGAALYGKVTPQEALDGAAVKANRLLSQRK